MLSIFSVFSCNFFELSDYNGLFRVTDERTRTTVEPRCRTGSFETCLTNSETSLLSYSDVLSSFFSSKSLKHKETKMSGKTIIKNGLKAAVNLGSSKLPKEILKNSSALLSSLSGKSHVLPDLPYDYNALEPVISAETMTLHHSKVRAAVNNSCHCLLFVHISFFRTSSFKLQ